MARSARVVRRGARQHRPRLRDRVDPALLVARGARAACRRRSSRGDTTRRPRPARACPRRPARLGAVAPGALGVAARSRQIGANARRTVAEEEAEPDALAAALDAHAVHAVVPVAAADERQPVRARGQAAIDRADAVLVERRRARPTPSAGRSRSCSSGSSGGASRNGTVSSRAPSSPVVARSAAAAYGSHSRSSEQRVRVPRPTARATSAGRRPRRTGARPRAGAARARGRAARSRAPSRPAAGRGSRRRRRAGRSRSAPRAARRAPGRAASGSSSGRTNRRASAPATVPSTRPSRPRPRAAPPARPRRVPKRARSDSRVRAVAALTQQEHDVARLARARASSSTWSARARVEPGAEAPGQRLARERRRPARGAVAAQELRAVAGRRARAARVDARERDASGEVLVVRVAREHGARARRAP